MLLGDESLFCTEYLWDLSLERQIFGLKEHFRFQRFKDDNHQFQYHWAFMPKLTVAGGLIVLVNIGFVAGGILLLRYNSTLDSNGWADVLMDTDYEAASSIVTSMLQLLGITIIALALVGIVGAIVQNRLLLVLYSIVMVVTMLAFGVLAGTALSFRTKMTDWETTSFPAENEEAKLAVKFNEIYCYAQGYYYCNHATAKEAYNRFVPNASSELANLLPNATGIVSLCDEIIGTTTVDVLNTVCEACKMSTTYAKYDKILTWAENQCPRNSATGIWCAAFLSTGTPGETYNGSPYGHCRPIFLDMAIDWSSTIATAGLIVALSAAIIVALACFTRRSKVAATDYDRVTEM
ncbi:unnamed protein product [Peronospora belbahrii]|uniref:Tetraspanin n=1 Tax=Peronospora belbahrii TaxID=622444 RepID=A0AAU9KHU5_9STRA|nr:unnamed protein product [Peronospora belbahrii]CAH0513375.1 unnamed protein product [Peronospora belbahrii]